MKDERKSIWIEVSPTAMDALTEAMIVERFMNSDSTLNDLLIQMCKDYMEYNEMERQQCLKLSSAS